MAQAVDFTTLVAICHELRQQCLPARLEQVVQTDSHTIFLVLRTVSGKLALLLSWHAQTARLHLSHAPASKNSTFVFAQQVWHQLHGLALVKIDFLAQWERVVDLGFARRPSDPILWHLYLEVMGKYSNALLVNQENIVVCLAHQVSDRQSRLRPIGTGDIYTPPPPLWQTAPSLGETLDQWCDRLNLVPQKIQDSFLKNYRGVSPPLVHDLLTNSQIPLSALNQDLSLQEWQTLYKLWRTWLEAIPSGNWQITTQEKGYRLTPSTEAQPLELAVNRFIDDYYRQLSQKENLISLYQKIQQIITRKLKKLRHKQQDLLTKVHQAKSAEKYREQADLLTAYAGEWRLGMQEIGLPDFSSGQPVMISLDPLLNAFQNAQILYKKYQKQKRASTAILPFLAEVNTEISYLESVEHNLKQVGQNDLYSWEILQEIAWELEEQGYLVNHHQSVKLQKKKTTLEQINCHRFYSPSNFLVLVGRNNWQNDQLSCHIASDYDLWFHAQEIAGSHVILRLDAGNLPADTDLQFCADLASWFSKGKYSDRLPVVYTKPKYLHKPKGAKLGMVLYTHETLIWGQPSTIQQILQTSN